MYVQDRSPDVDDVEGLAVAATKHLELLKQEDKADGSLQSYLYFIFKPVFIFGCGVGRWG